MSTASVMHLILIISDTEVELRTQSSRPRPRAQKKSEAKDSPIKDRPFQGQGQECSRPRTKDTGGKVFSPPKKGLKLVFQAISRKNGL